MSDTRKAEVADRERVVEAFARVLASVFGGWPEEEWHLRTKPNYYTDKAEVIFDRFPHIAEGWPTGE